MQPRPQSASGYCYSGRLLFFRLSGIPATPGYRVLHFIASPSCCPFSCRSRIPGRSVIQAYGAITPEGFRIRFSSIWGPKPFCFLRPCDSISERTFPVFVDLLNIRGPGPFCSDFGSPDAQTRRSD